VLDCWGDDAGTRDQLGRSERGLRRALDDLFAECGLGAVGGDGLGVHDKGGCISRNIFRPLDQLVVELAVLGGLVAHGVDDFVSGLADVAGMEGIIGELGDFDDRLDLAKEFLDPHL
jgi:hypothetical protein